MSSHKKRRKKHIKKERNNKGINSKSRQITEETAGGIIEEITTDDNDKDQNDEGSDSTTSRQIGKTAGSIVSPTAIGKISGAAGGEKTSSTTASTGGKKTGTTTGTTTGVTAGSTTGAETGGTISSILDSLTLDEVTKIRVIIGAIGDLNVAKLSLLGLAINETDRVYYDNRLKPLVDALYNIGVASASLAAVANNFDSSVFAKKHEIKKALNITYELNDSMEIVSRILKCRLEYYEENSDWCK